MYVFRIACQFVVSIPEDVVNWKCQFVIFTTRGNFGLHVSVGDRNRKYFGLQVSVCEHCRVVL